ncbi:hypothetical protein JCM19300_1063 [Algibacter lectus]|uniref:Uncharacterized protein n=1 Tax=Algibacter lectus TaxID=221126 RepID=A0A090VE46_9FLAO|nr:hypothetical protein JCM19300_1063 [Algibacter lectus]
MIFKNIRFTDAKKRNLFKKSVVLLKKGFIFAPANSNVNNFEIMTW